MRVGLTLSTAIPPLDSCSNKATVIPPAPGQHAGTQPITQPPGGDPSMDRVGLTQRWDPLPAGASSNDVAAAFLNNDTQEGNGSLRFEKKIEGWAGSFTGMGVPPVKDRPVTIVSSNFHPPAAGEGHVFTAQVTELDLTVMIQPASPSCNNGAIYSLVNQMKFQITDGNCIQKGDSGSPILDQSGNIVGMVTAFAPTPHDQGGLSIRAQVTLWVW